MGSNFLPRLTPDLFREELPNLQKIFLDRCSVSKVDDHCFRQVHKPRRRYIR